MNVTVTDGCISCGLCTEEYPDLFAMNDEGMAMAVSSLIPAGKERAAIQAAEECPVSVIKLD